MLIYFGVSYSVYNKLWEQAGPLIYIMGTMDLGCSLMRPFNNPPLQVRTFRDIYEWISMFEQNTRKIAFQIKFFCELNNQKNLKFKMLEYFQNFHGNTAYPFHRLHSTIFVGALQMLFAMK